MAGQPNRGRTLVGTGLVLLAATCPNTTLDTLSLMSLMICLRPVCPHSYFRVGHNNRCNLSPREQSLLRCYLGDSHMGIPNVVFISPDGLCVLNVCVELLLSGCCFSVVVALFLRQSLIAQTGFRLTGLDPPASAS